MSNETKTVIWSDTARNPRMLMIDARALIPMAIWALHICWATLYVAMTGVFLFSALERFNISPMCASRILKTKAIGPKRPVIDKVIFLRRSRG